MGITLENRRLLSLGHLEGGREFIDQLHECRKFEVGVHLVRVQPKNTLSVLIKRDLKVWKVCKEIKTEMLIHKSWCK